MWKLVLLCFVCVNMRVMCHIDLAKRNFQQNPANKSVLRKCCDADSVLSSRSISNTSNTLICIQENTFTNINFYSLKTFGEVIYGFPERCDVENVVNTDLEELSTDSCVDKLVVDGEENKVTGLKCKSDESTIFQREVTYVKKCCGKEHKYDRKTHSCIKSGRNTQVEEKLIEFHGGNIFEFVDVTIGMPKCPQPQVMIDFQTSVEEHWNSSTLCVDELTHVGKFGGRRCVNDSKMCETMLCIPKCCAAGRSTVGARCVASDRGFNPAFFNTSTRVPKQIASPTEFGIIHGLKCKEGKYILDPFKEPDHLFYLDVNGSLLHYSTKRWYVLGEFCLEDVHNTAKDMNGIYAFVCFPEHPPKLQSSSIKLVLIPIGLIISSICLLATLFVYAFLPSLHRNLHGKTLMFLIVNYLAAFICLATVQIGTNKFSRPVCKVLSFCLLFSWLSSFSWLNVMCFDIWRTFGVMQHGTQRKSECKRLWIYALYAWSLPTVVTTAALVMEHVDGFSPDVIKPQFGHSSCWFHKENHAELVFFVIPSSLMLLCNLVLFVLTLRWVLKVSSEFHRMGSTVGSRSKERYRADKSRFSMISKLFVIMGLMWIFEFISGRFPDSPKFWILFDIVNTLQGVLIFVIFVINRRVLHELAVRLGIPCCRMKSPNNATPTNITNQELRPADSVNEELL